MSDVLNADPVAAAIIIYMREKAEPVAHTAAALPGIPSDLVSHQQLKAKS